VGTKPALSNFTSAANFHPAPFRDTIGVFATTPAVAVVSNVGTDGGGIYNVATNRLTTVTITNSTISGNSATGRGGGIFTQGLGGDATLTVSNSTISGNSAAGNGGGISSGAFGLEHGASSTVVVSNSTLSGNLTASDGGAIYNAAGRYGEASLLVNSCTISGNWATGDGGGIYINNNLGFTGLELGGTILNAGRSCESEAEFDEFVSEYMNN
jgi:predicted outer membrane repeat protein